MVTQIEIVSSDHLRNTLGLATRDQVGIEVDLDQDTWSRAVLSSGGLVEVGGVPGI